MFVRCVHSLTWVTPKDLCPVPVSISRVSKGKLTKRTAATQELHTALSTLSARDEELRDCRAPVPRKP
jgi:hypothetical protein